MQYIHPAIVIGGGINGLGIIRNLGRNAIDTHCLVDSPQNVAIYSRYCRGHHVLPAVDSDRRVLLKGLTRYRTQFATMPVLFPISDLGVLNLTQLLAQEKELREQYATSLPSFDTALTLVEKKQFYQSLDHYHIRYPMTYYVTPTTSVDSMDMMSFPVFVKPSNSQRFFRRFRSKGFIAHSRRELQQYLHIAHAQNLEMVVQQIIRGPSSNHILINGLFNQKGQPSVLVARQKLRQPSNFAICSAQVSIPRSDVQPLVDDIITYLRALKYRGIFGAEFKRDVTRIICWK
jgi:predicted ATP-grasp superfamily ATP-dependent carboligase